MELLEQKLSGIETVISHLESPALSDVADAEKQESAKLKFQLAQLKKYIDYEKSRSVKLMASQKHICNELFKIAIHKAFPQLAQFDETVQLSTKQADYQCNLALPLSKQLKQAPAEIAKQIIACVPANDVIDKVEASGPGFINIHIKQSFISDQMHLLAACGVRPPYCGGAKRVVVDFSSPNIAKEMHVGHLRSTIIGDAISRLCEFVGHDVLRLNHVGDWGTQFGMLIAHLQDRFPNYINESPAVSDLQAFYKESKKRFDTDEQFKARAYACVVKLQAREADYVKAWTLICDASRAEFEKIYARLDIKVTERGESFYQDLMQIVVKELKAKNLLELDEGRLIMFPYDRSQPPPAGDKGAVIPLTVVKSDGGFTYDTSDMAALWQRLTAEKADWIIYVVDSGQSVHFDTLFPCAARCGWFNAERTRVEHVGFGVVLGEDGKKFKTRSGDTVRLVDLLDEGLTRAGEKLKQKERDQVLSEAELERIKEAVAYGCIKYSDLAHNRTLDYVFSFDKMLDDKGNTAVYLLYAYMRIRSIARTAGLSPQQLADAAQSTPFLLRDPKELKLAKALLRLPEVVLQTLDSFAIHLLCEYLYTLCNVFTEFYASCYCIERDSAGQIANINMERMLLCEGTANVLKAGFDILGLKTLERM